MSKTMRGTKLPRKLEQEMQTVGEQIKLARLSIKENGYRKQIIDTPKIRYYSII